MPPVKGSQRKPTKPPAKNGLVIPRVTTRVKKGAANIALTTTETKPGKGSKGGRPSTIDVKVSADYARASRMFMLRAAGANYDQIGKSEGISGPQAHRILDSHMKNMHVEGMKTVKMALVHKLNEILYVNHDATIDADHPKHVSASQLTFGAIDRIMKILRVDEYSFEGDEDMTGVPTGGAKLVLGLTRDEYMAMLKTIEDRQNKEIYDDPNDRPPGMVIDDDDVAEAEVVE